jgi:hypothetical protein
MSACWDSEVKRAAPLAGLVLAFLGLAFASTAQAGGGSVDRVRVGPDGVVVERGSDGDPDSVEVHIVDKHRSAHLGRDGWIEVDDHGDALVRVFGDIHVPAGKRVLDDVVAVFGSVEVDGVVEGDVVAVLGSVHVREGAEVQGEVVSVGGMVDQDDGGVIQGQTVSVGFFPVSWGFRALPLTLSAIAAGFLAAVLGGWIFAFAFPTRLVRVASTASRRTGASLLLGLVSVPGFVALIVLMFVTVVGIPLAFLLPFAYVILAYAGNLAATYVLGSKLTGRRLGQGGLLGPIVAGSMLVALFFVVGAVLFTAPGMTRPIALFSAMLGCLLAVGLTAIGTGAFLLSRFGTLPKDLVPSSEAAATLSAPMPAPSPPSA